MKFSAQASRPSGRGSTPTLIARIFVCADEGWPRRSGPVRAAVRTPAGTLTEEELAVVSGGAVLNWVAQSNLGPDRKLGVIAKGEVLGFDIGQSSSAAASVPAWSLLPASASHLTHTYHPATRK